MIMSLILTLVILVCYWLATAMINSAPIGNSNVKWGVVAIATLIAIVAILGIWGLIPAGEFHR
jgi:hypothetical protein